MSDFEAQRLQRMKQLEEKKKRLEEMRKQRAEGAAQPSSVASSSALSSLDDSSTAGSKRDVDELVKSLLNSKISETSAEEAKAIAPTPTQQSNVQDVKPARKANLSFVSRVSSVSVLPILKPETYDKETMTEESSSSITDETEEHASSYRSTRRINTQAKPTTRQTNIRSPAHASHDVHSSLTESADIKPLSLESRLSAAQSDSKNVTHTSTVIDFAEVLNKPSFMSFMSSAGRVMERAMAASAAVDIFQDYSLGSSEGGRLRSLKDRVLLPSTSFESSSIKGRPVLDIFCSSKYPELLLAAYGSKAFPTGSTSSPTDNVAGIVVVWSRLTPSRPEFTFHAPSPVHVARFLEDADSPPLLVGGCYSGQLLLWDMRAKALPVHRSSPAGKGHKHPVIEVLLAAQSANLPANSSVSATAVPSNASHNELFSISMDGLACQWDVARLTDPTETFPASNLPGYQPGSTAMNITAVGFGIDDNTGRIAVYGTGSGSLLRSTFPARADGAKASVRPVEAAHGGTVTAVDLHPSSRQIYRPLVLTASLDWTIKLWNFSASPDTPLLVLQSPSYDYVSDVKWSPSNPNVFAAATSSGDILIYNLAKSTTEPITRTLISKCLAELSAPSTPAALNRLQWGLDGKSLLVGDSRGGLYNFVCHESVTVAAAGDETKFELNMLSLVGKK